MLYLVYSLWFGRKAPANPWNAKGLEWETASPPPKHNFHSPPEVPRIPYDYPIQAQEARDQHG